MTNKSGIPPAVAEFALEQLADNGYSAHDMATAKASGFREAEAIAAEEIERLRAALEVVSGWKLPSTGQYWPIGGGEMSYGACFGSNGEREYLRGVAGAALTGVEESQ